MQYIHYFVETFSRLQQFDVRELNPATDEEIIQLEQELSLPSRLPEALREYLKYTKNIPVFAFYNYLFLYDYHLSYFDLMTLNKRKYPTQSLRAEFGEVLIISEHNEYNHFICLNNGEDPTVYLRQGDNEIDIASNSFSDFLCEIALFAASCTRKFPDEINRIIFNFKCLILDFLDLLDESQCSPEMKKSLDFNYKEILSKLQEAYNHSTRIWGSDMNPQASRWNATWPDKIKNQAEAIFTYYHAYKSDLIRANVIYE